MATLLRKSRTDKSSIIFDDTTGFYGILTPDDTLSEESDDLATLLASGNWRRPLQDELESFTYTPSNGTDLTLPSVDTDLLIKSLQRGKISKETVKELKPYLEKLEDWADNVTQPEELAFEFIPDFDTYYAVSDKESSTLVNELWASDTEGDLFYYTGTAFEPSQETIETFERPTIIPIDPETAERLAEWVFDQPIDLEYFDIYYTNAEEGYLADDALEEMDLTLLDDETDAILATGEFWYDDADKHIRQKNQERDWHGRYSGAQHDAAKKVFYPKARISETLEVDLDPLKTISQNVAAATVEPGGENTLYVAIVDSIDRTAVLDIIAIVSDIETGRPTSWIRRGSKWVQDDTYLDQIQSVTPPTTIILDADDVDSVIRQVDETDTKRSVEASSVVSQVLSEHSEEYSQEDRDSIIACAISHGVTEVIPSNWYRTPITNLYGKYGEVLIAAGIPGIADTPSDFAATARLKNYWAFGKGMSKWLPGTPGDLTRLHRHLAKYVGPERAWGLAQNIHKMHFGISNNKRDK